MVAIPVKQTSLSHSFPAPFPQRFLSRARDNPEARRKHTILHPSPARANWADCFPKQGATESPQSWREIPFQIQKCHCEQKSQSGKNARKTSAGKIAVGMGQGRTSPPRSPHRKAGNEIVFFLSGKGKDLSKYSGSSSVR